VSDHAACNAITRALLAEKDERIAELEAAQKGLKEFAREVIRETWYGAGHDGAGIQDLALECGLLHEQPYADHLDGGEAAAEFGLEPGDPFYMFTAALGEESVSPSWRERSR